MDEVRTIISAITNTASGNDELPASILKQCTDSYLQPLTHLINLSISLGIVPDELKVARVIPIFKACTKLSSYFRTAFFSTFFDENMAPIWISKKSFPMSCYNYSIGTSFLKLLILVHMWLVVFFT